MHVAIYSERKWTKIESSVFTSITRIVGKGSDITQLHSTSLSLSLSLSFSLSLRVKFHRDMNVTPCARTGVCIRAQTRRCECRRISIERRIRTYMSGIEVRLRNTRRDHRENRNHRNKGAEKVRGVRLKVMSRFRRSSSSTKLKVEMARDWAIIISCRDICHAPMYSTSRTTTTTTMMTTHGVAWRASVHRKSQKWRPIN